MNTHIKVNKQAFESGLLGKEIQLKSANITRLAGEQEQTEKWGIIQLACSDGYVCG